MSDQGHSTTEILVGGGVLAAAVAFFFYAAAETSPADGPGAYPLTASFRSVEGISVGTDVRMAGVRIGTVTGIELDPVTYRAVTSFTVPGSLEIPDDSAVAINSEGLLGGSFVEIIPGGSPFPLEPGGEITDTQGAVSLITLLSRFVAGSSDE